MNRFLVLLFPYPFRLQFVLFCLNIALYVPRSLDPDDITTLTGFFTQGMHFFLVCGTFTRGRPKGTIPWIRIDTGTTPFRIFFFFRFDYLLRLRIIRIMSIIRLRLLLVLLLLLLRG